MKDLVLQGLAVAVAVAAPAVAESSFHLRTSWLASSTGVMACKQQWHHGLQAALETPRLKHAIILRPWYKQLS